MRSFRRTVFSTLIGLLMFGAFVQVGTAADLSGKYKMKGQGTLPNDPAYGGQCELKLNGRVYDVTCLNDNGDRYVGKGILEGEVFSLYLGEYLVVYRVASDRVLKGQWAHSRSQGVGQETLTPIQ